MEEVEEEEVEEEEVEEVEEVEVEEKEKEENSSIVFYLSQIFLSLLLFLTL